MCVIICQQKAVRHLQLVELLAQSASHQPLRLRNNRMALSVSAVKQLVV